MKKPEDLKEYIVWLKEHREVTIDERTRTHYASVSRKIKEDIEQSDFWKALLDATTGWSQQYYLEKKYPLFANDPKPELKVKPYDSFLHKTFRKNILSNNNWPNEPPSGWVLPSNWISIIGDIVRTLFTVKYLDGVEIFAENISSLSKSMGLESTNDFEAKEEGYYAAHSYIRIPCEIPKIDWDTENVMPTLEIHITTQLQDVIRKLLHKFYEKRRKGTSLESRKWQWDYKSDEFGANYLGHILHYVEGMIMELREKQEGDTK
jgi:hypothetical protein